MKCLSSHAARWALVLLVAGAAIPMAARAATATLKVGSDAPPVAVVKWFKGTPVDTLEKGKVYVVEFWATWCPDCRAAVPHLTEMAHQYGDKVTFVGVSVREHQSPDYLAKIESFVKEMGDKMDYHVAADDQNTGTMLKTWMNAAGHNGIPTAFVIGKDGKIAWIGSPGQGMDKQIDRVLAGA